MKILAVIINLAFLATLPFAYQTSTLLYWLNFFLEKAFGQVAETNVLLVLAVMYPIFVVLANIISWTLLFFKKPKAAFYISLLPLIPAIVFLTYFFLVFIPAQPGSPA